MGDEPLGLDEYRALVEERIPARGTATKPLDECLGLTLASDAPARIPVPPFTNSAMDGRALRLFGLPPLRDHGEALEALVAELDLSRRV